jgi:hypothetical protein
VLSEVVRGPAPLAGPQSFLTDLRGRLQGEWRLTTISTTTTATSFWTGRRCRVSRRSDHAADFRAGLTTHATGIGSTGPKQDATSVAAT